MASLPVVAGGTVFVAAFEADGGMGIGEDDGVLINGIVCSC